MARFPIGWRFDEWVLRQDSRIPGWTCIQDFFDTVVSNGDTLTVLVLAWRRPDDGFASPHSFDYRADAHSSVTLMRALRKSSLILVPVSQGDPLVACLGHYELASSGVYTPEVDGDLFGTSVAWEPCESLSRSSDVLAIHHDGEPLILFHCRKASFESC